MLCCVVLCLLCCAVLFFVVFCCVVLQCMDSSFQIENSKQHTTQRICEQWNLGILWMWKNHIKAWACDLSRQLFVSNTELSCISYQHNNIWCRDCTQTSVRRTRTNCEVPENCVKINIILTIKKHTETHALLNFDIYIYFDDISSHIKIKESCVFSSELQLAYSFQDIYVLFYSFYQASTFLYDLVDKEDVTGEKVGRGLQNLIRKSHLLLWAISFSSKLWGKWQVKLERMGEIEIKLLSSNSFHVKVHRPNAYISRFTGSRQWD